MNPQGFFLVLLLLASLRLYAVRLVCQGHQECLLAYFSGKSVDEIYLDQPRGGLPGLKPGQLLRAKKAIFGFAEAARLFWLALREHLENHGWHMSRLEPALFYLRRDKKVIGVLVTHVDDIEGGVHPKYLDNAFYHPSRALEFATNHFKDFIFRGREVKQTPDGHIDISMRNYALSMKRVKVTKEQRQQLEKELTPARWRPTTALPAKGAGSPGNFAATWPTRLTGWCSEARLAPAWPTLFG